MNVGGVRVARDSMIGLFTILHCVLWRLACICQSMNNPDEVANHEEDEPGLKMHVVHKSA
jgi:hypothetical protein